MPQNIFLLFFFNHLKIYKPFIAHGQKKRSGRIWPTDHNVLTPYLEQSSAFFLSKLFLEVYGNIHNFKWTAQKFFTKWTLFYNSSEWKIMWFYFIFKNIYWCHMLTHRWLGPNLCVKLQNASRNRNGNSLEIEVLTFCLHSKEMCVIQMSLSW